MTYVLAGLQLRRPRRHLRQVFAWIEWLRPWSMVEVYLLGVFVAYVKLIDLVHIELGPALYALGALMLTMVAADAVLDRQAVWEALDRQDPGAGGRPCRGSPAAPGIGRDRLRGLRPALPARPRRPCRTALPAAARICMRASRTASRAPGR